MAKRTGQASGARDVGVNCFGLLNMEAALLRICSNKHSTIVHECERCPLCALTEHNNTVHDFIESKGRVLVSELVEYQHRKAAEQGEAQNNSVGVVGGQGTANKQSTPLVFGNNTKICDKCARLPSACICDK